MGKFFFRLFYVPLGYFIFTLVCFLVYAEFYPDKTMESMKFTELLAFLGPGLFVASFFAWRIGRSVSWQLTELNRRVEEFPRIREYLPEMSGVQEYLKLARSLQDFMIRIRDERNDLQLEKELLRSLLGAFQDGVFCLDREGKIIYRNPALSDKLLYADAHGKPYFRAVRNASVLEFVHDVMQSDNGNGRGEEGEEPGFRFEAGDRFYKMNYYPVQLHGAEAGLFLFIVHDETRQRNVTRLRQEFLQNASHELKTPVTSIRGYAESMLPRMQDPQHNNFLKAILRNALRMQSIIEDMVTISSVESGEYPLNRKQANARRYLDGIRELVAGSLAKKEQMLEMDCSPDIVLNHDLLLLEHLLLNLIVNASRYSPDGSRIRVLLEQNGGNLNFSVIDEGPGIPTEHRDKIFERFYRVDHNRSRQEGGTGLGLSIVRHVTRVHGGRVWVEDGPEGKGAAFQVVLPMK